jgi:predicted GNAT superfamily acetyltransferase
LEDHHPETVIRAITSVSELQACRQLEESVWGETDLLPVPLMIAVNEAGGLTAGAFSGGMLVGYAFGFPGTIELNGRSVAQHHSHILAVLPGRHGRGTGQRLKQFQAQWCLERGIEVMTWTFDPLRARNAHLNLERLGATSRSYRPDHYGSMGDAQNSELETDRLLAVWQLRDRPTGPRAAPDFTRLPAALARQEDGRPAEPDLTLDSPQLLVGVPPDLDQLLLDDMPQALLWRARVRSVLQHYFSAGYTASRFLGGHYLLTR